MIHLIDFYLPIKSDWTPEEFHNIFYDKIKNNLEIYKYTWHLKRLKNAKTMQDFIKYGENDFSQVPLIYFLALICNSSYIKSKTLNLKNNEILIFRYTNYTPWPTANHNWFDFVGDQRNFDFYLNL